MIILNIMTYLNNQYLKLDLSLKEIAKIKIKTDENNKVIKDLIIEDNPNIIITYGKVNYNDIFNSVKILITNIEALIYNNFNIPKFIETIIIYNCLYHNIKLELEKIKNSFELFDAINKKNQKLAIEILENKEININQLDNIDYTVIIRACINDMKLLVFKLYKHPDINFYYVNKLGYASLIQSWITLERFGK